MENRDSSRNSNTQNGQFGVNIPLFSGRPLRDHEINGNDIFNLKIALHVCKNFDDLIKNM